ncbi:MAG TPA: hypothetical protein VN364_12995 [Bellilinea sp.]|nr:hypothetical protein [Bellilinea sp.]
MKLSRSAKVRFKDGHLGSAIAAHIKLNASANRISRIDREGVVLIHLTVKSPQEIAADLSTYIARLLTINVDRVEVVGQVDSLDRLVTVTGMSAADLQQKIVNIAS